MRLSIAEIALEGVVFDLPASLLYISLGALFDTRLRDRRPLAAWERCTRDTHRSAILAWSSLVHRCSFVRRSPHSTSYRISTVSASLVSTRGEAKTISSDSLLKQNKNNLMVKEREGAHCLWFVD